MNKLIDAIKKMSARSFVSAALICAALLTSGTVSALNFNADTRVSVVSGLSLNPRIAASGGTLHVVWQEAVAGAQPYIIYYSRSQNNGQSWEAARAISNPGLGSAYWPDITAANGAVNVFWNTDPDSGEVYQARSNNNGTNFSAPINMSNAAGFSRAPRAVQDGNVVHLTYYDSRFSAGVGRAVYQLSCDGGATFGPLENLSASAGDIDDESPRIAATEAGIPFITFRSSREGLPQGGWPPYRIFVLKGRSVDCGSLRTQWFYPAQRVSNPSSEEQGSPYSTGVKRGISGRMHLAFWDTQNGGANVTYRKGNPAGKGWDAPQNLSNFPATHTMHYGVTVEGSDPAVSEDSRGKVHVFYSANNATDQDFQVGPILYRESLDGGTSFQAAQQLVAQRAMTPQSIVHNGRVHLVWADLRDNNTGAEIYHKFANEDSSPQPVADSDGDGIPNNIEASVGRNPNLKDNDIFANNQLFAMQQYRDFLGREGDSGGVNFWLTELNAGRQSKASMVESFTTSGEFDSLTAPIARLYFGTYLRIPDYGGLAFWTDEYRSGRRSLVNIGEAFTAAPEFVARYGNVDNTTYVNLLFQNVLARAADQTGLNFWVNELISGRLTRGAMLTQFTENPEYRARRRAEIFTTLMFAGMLRRAPEQAAFNANVNLINSSGTFQQSIAGVLGSNEYRTRFLP